MDSLKNFCQAFELHPLTGFGMHGNVHLDAVEKGLSIDDIRRTTPMVRGLLSCLGPRCP
jgi:hypothetical protein